jgi:hypothetical protein
MKLRMEHIIKNYEFRMIDSAKKKMFMVQITMLVLNIHLLASFLTRHKTHSNTYLTINLKEFFID